MDLSVIIINWNTRDLVVACLDSVFAYPPECEFDVWVVDNASSDDSASVVEKRFPQIHLIRNTKNEGFAAANNQGIRASASRYVLLLNSDTVVQVNALTRMVKFMEGHPDAGIAGGKLVWPDGGFQSSFNDFPNFLSDLVTSAGLARHVYGQYFPSYSPPQSQDTRTADWVGGAFLCARRKATEEVGLLDEGYFMYGEEMDWCYRMWQKDWKVYFSPDAQVVHLGSRSSNQASSDKLKWLTQGHIRFALKHKGLFWARLLAVIVPLVSFLKTIAWLTVGLFSRRNRQFAWAKANSHWQLVGFELF